MPVRELHGRACPRRGHAGVFPRSLRTRASSTWTPSRSPSARLLWETSRVRGEKPSPVVHGPAPTVGPQTSPAPHSASAGGDGSRRAYVGDQHEKRRQQADDTAVVRATDVELRLELAMEQREAALLHAPTVAVVPPHVSPRSKGVVATGSTSGAPRDPGAGLGEHEVKAILDYK